jgi:integrating conjugative element protein (TIGR03765 family)
MMKKTKPLLRISKNIFLIVGLLLAKCIIAEPHVIYDSGITKTTKTYMASVKKPNRQALKQSSAIKPRIKTPPRLPVYTSALTPGTVNSKKINHPLLDRPFFIVGADRLSHHWLIENREQLKTLHAIGIVVNVQTEQQLSDLEDSAGGMRLNPIKGGKMARQLSLNHYPVLISGGLIEQ